MSKTKRSVSLVGNWGLTDFRNRNNIPLMVTHLPCKCRVCGYEWESRLNRDPKQCPRCKRYDWQAPIKREKAEATK